MPQIINAINESDGDTVALHYLRTHNGIFSGMMPDGTLRIMATKSREALASMRKHFDPTDSGGFIEESASAKSMDDIIQEWSKVGIVGVVVWNEPETTSSETKP